MSTKKTGGNKFQKKPNNWSVEYTRKISDKYFKNPPTDILRLGNVHNDPNISQFVKGQYSNGFDSSEREELSNRDGAAKHSDKFCRGC